ncbi:hypothetical protein, partial [Pelagibius sp.]|uniref:hypothetical protein n=1 Tax=Pelagibius sp. TaxID=1931238 RepID=UPI00260F2652
GIDVAEVTEATVEVGPAAAFSDQAGSAAGDGAQLAEAGSVDDAAAPVSAAAGKIDDVADSIDDVADDVADDLAEGLNKTRDGAKQANKPDGSDSVADAASDEGVQGARTEGLSPQQRAAIKISRRVGATLKLGGQTQQGEVKVETGFIERKQDSVQADMQRTDAYIQFEESSRSDNQDNLTNICSALTDSFKEMGKINTSFLTQGQATAGAIGAAGRDGTA